MKIRTGFVSNSSSSSFVVLLNEVPGSVDETIKLLFDRGQEKYEAPYDNTSYDLEEVAEEVLKQLRVGRELTEDDVVNVLCSGWLPGLDLDDFTDEKHSLDFKSYEEAARRLARERLRDLLTKHPDKKRLFRLVFSDNTSFGGALEHGNLLKNVPHVKVSHH